MHTNLLFLTLILYLISCGNSNKNKFNKEEEWIKNSRDTREEANNNIIENYRSLKSIEDPTYDYYEEALKKSLQLKYDEAILDLNVLISTNPKDLRALCLRGSIYSMLGKYNEAFIDADNAIKFHPKEPLGYSSRSIIYYNIKEYDEAIFDANRAIERMIGDQKAYGYHSRSILKYKLKDNNGAISDINKAISFGLNDERFFIAKKLYTN